MSDGRNQVEAWRQNVAPLWHVEAAADTVPGFRGRSVVHNMGRLIMGQVAVSAHRIRRDTALIARMGMDHVLVQFRATGAFNGTAEGRELRVGAGDIAFFDMSRPFEASYTDYAGITMAVPRSLFGDRLGPLDAVHGLVLPGAAPLGSLLAGHLRAIAAHADRLTVAESGAAADGTAALIAACLAPALGGASRTMNHPRAPVLLMAVRRFIDARLRDPALSADAVARQFGVSRSSLYRLFEPVGSIGAYVRQRRLAGAFRDLTRPGTAVPVQDIAHRWCFGNASAFNGAFRREYGMTPGEARRHVVAGPRSGRSVPAEGQWRDLQTWLTTLDGYDPA